MKNKPTIFYKAFFVSLMVVFQTLVIAQAPDWNLVSFNFNNYEYNASVTSKVIFNGSETSNPDDLIAFFCETYGADSTGFFPGISVIDAESATVNGTYTQVTGYSLDPCVYQIVDPDHPIYIHQNGQYLAFKLDGADQWDISDLMCNTLYFNDNAQITSGNWSSTSFPSTTALTLVGTGQQAPYLAFKGSSESVFIPGFGYRQFTTVYSNSSVNDLVIQFFNADSNKVFPATTTYKFLSQQITGNTEDPFNIRVYSDNDAPILLQDIKDQVTLEGFDFDSIDLNDYLVSGDDDPIDWSVIANPVLLTRFSGGTREGNRCATPDANDLPRTIEDNRVDTVLSTILIADEAYVHSVSISSIYGEHSYSGDLSFSLISPMGTRVRLLSNQCGNSNNFDFAISDNASQSIDCPMDQGLVYTPEESLSVLQYEPVKGQWTLEIIDDAMEDGGTLLGWELDICYGPLPVTPILNVSGVEGFTGTTSLTVIASEQTPLRKADSVKVNFTILPGYQGPVLDVIPGQGTVLDEGFQNLCNGNDTLFNLLDFEKAYEGSCLEFDYLPVINEDPFPDSDPNWMLTGSWINSMTVNAQVLFTPNYQLNDPADRLAAFINGELRGIAAPTTVGNDIYYFLTVNGGPGDGEITLQYYSNERKKLYTHPETIPYDPYTLVGKVDEPYTINLCPLLPAISENGDVAIDVVDSSWIGFQGFEFFVRDCNFPQFLMDSAISYFCVVSDESELAYYYKDADQDRHGDPNIFTQHCLQPLGYSLSGLDCDDTDPDKNPDGPFHCCQDILLTLDEDANAILTPDLIDSTRWDLCGILDNIVSDSLFYCGDVGDNLVQLSVYDLNENVDMCLSLVTVQDSIRPRFECPATIILSSCLETIPDVVAMIKETMDTCGVDTIIQVPQKGLPAGNEHLDSLKVIVTVYDVFGNATSCTVPVIIQDTIPPTFINCPQDTVYTVALWPSICQAGVIWPIPVPADECYGVEVYQSGGPAQDSILTVGTYQIDYTARDRAGNTSPCQFTIEVIDTQQPFIVCPVNQLSVKTDRGTCQWQSPTGALRPLLSTGNCDYEVRWEIIRSGIPVANGMDDVSGEVFQLGKSTVRYVIEEITSRQQWTCEFNVIVEDREAPTIECPDTLRIQCENPENEQRILNWINSTTAQDNCSANPEIDFFIENIDPRCGFTEFISYVFTATDSSGNQTSCSAFVSVLDTISPAITGGRDMTVECASGGGLNQSDFLSWINNNAYSTASDLCGQVTWSNDYTSSRWVEVCEFVRYIDVTFTATDACGNRSSTTHRFGTDDTTPPAFTNCPRPDLVVKAAPGTCGSFVNFSLPQAIDACDQTVEVRQIDGSGLQSGEMFPVGRTPLLYEAIDCSGNSTTCRIVIFVNDEDIPVMDCPDDVFLQTDAGKCTAAMPRRNLTLDDACRDHLSLIYKIEFPAASGEIIHQGIDIAHDVDIPQGLATIHYRVQDQPLVLITEVTQDITLTNGGTDPVPTYIQNLSSVGDDYLEITNFGPADYDLGGLEIERSGTGNDPENEMLVLPDSIVLKPGEVLVVHFGPGVDSPQDRFFNLPLALDLPYNAGSAYSISLKGRVIDAVAINGFMAQGQGHSAVIDTTDWSGIIPTVGNHGSIFRSGIWDNNDAKDWALSNVCEPATIGSYNKGFPVLSPNGTNATLQHQDPHRIECSVELIVDDLEAPLCGTIEPHLYSGGAANIRGGSLVKSTIVVDENFEIGEARILMLSGDHDQMEKISIKLVSPKGTVLKLGSPLCNGPGEFSLGFNDTASISIADINCANVDQGNSFRPEDALTMLHGESSQGEWALFIADESDGFKGSIDGWTLHLGERIAYNQGDTLMTNAQDLCGMDFSWVHPEIFDNCGSGTLEVFYSSVDAEAVPKGGPVEAGQIQNTFFHVGKTLVEYTLKDKHENVAFCSFEVTILDTQQPELINVPKDRIINLGPGKCGLEYYFNYEAEDNCGMDTIIAIPANGTYLDIGAHTIEVIAIDKAGNENRKKYQVEINGYLPVRQNLACNTLINISLGKECLHILDPDEVLEGNDYRCYQDYILKIVALPDRISHSASLTLDDVGKCLEVTVTDPVTNNSCWGTVCVEDKQVPEIQCPSDTSVFCNAITDPDATGNVELLSCEVSYQSYHFDEWIMNADCDTIRASIKRDWSVEDESGNTTACTQWIHIKGVDLSEIEFPADYDDISLPALDCSDTGKPTGTPEIGGISVYDNNGFCRLTVRYDDEQTTICGSSYEIIRRWSVRDLCKPLVDGINPLVHQQVIRYVDKSGPDIIYPDTITVGVNVANCTADWIVSPPTLIDECQTETSYSVLSRTLKPILLPNGNWSISKLKLGVHQVTILAHDACGRKNSKDFIIRVVDDLAPVAVCNAHTIVSITGGTDPARASTYILASALDAGSYDNCSPVWFKAMRIQSNACMGINGDDDPVAPGNQEYPDDRVEFCCSDVGDSIQVSMLVFDLEPPIGPVHQADLAPGGKYHDHTTECMVWVHIQNEEIPVVIAPPTIVMSCQEDLDFDALEDPMNPKYGRILPAGIPREKVITNSVVCPSWCNPQPRYAYLPPVGIDDKCTLYDPAMSDQQFSLDWGYDGFVHRACGIVPELEIIDERICGQGRIIRKISVPGPNGIVSATQTIYVIDCLTYAIRDNDCSNADDQDGIIWPCPVILNGCGVPTTPDSTGIPQIIDPGTSCSMIASQHQDNVFGPSGGYCEKIMRQWTVIDWCQYDPALGLNSPGRWSYFQEILIQDNSPPYFLDCNDIQQCDTTLVDTSGIANCLVPISLIFTGVDSCTSNDMLEVAYYIDLHNDGNYDYAVEEAPGGKSNNPRAYDMTNARNASGDYPIGQHMIRWTSTDACGLTSECTQLFTLEDCEAPVALCRTGLVTVIMPGSGNIIVTAEYFDAGSFDECNGPLTFSFDMTGRESEKLFDCDDIGLIPIEISISDANGNLNHCSTTLNLQDPNDVCTQTVTATISGKLLNRKTALPMEATLSRLYDNDELLTEEDITDNEGNYAFPNLPMGGYYIVRPYKNDDPTNGVSTRDLIMIQQHLLGKITLSDPYDLIAGDINNSGGITAKDVLELRKMILGIHSSFEEINEDQTSWRFVSAGHIFPDSLKPYVYPEKATITELSADTSSLNFYGVKIGDLDGNARLKGHLTQSRSLSVMPMAWQYKTLENGLIEIELISDGLKELVGMQFTLNFDPKKLVYRNTLGTYLDVNEENVGTRWMEEGILTFSWSDPETKGVTIPDGKVLLHLYFEKSDLWDTMTSLTDGDIEINSLRTSNEAYDIKGQIYELTLKWKKESSRQNKWNLQQNIPNPFLNGTEIYFEVTDPQILTLKVFNQSGQFIHSQTINWPGGKGVFRIERETLGKPGIYYYQLQGKDQSRAKRMVLIN